ncbi:MAG: hypothetical protein J5637_08725 [Prevotella sp.]|nr:hypothetical protein [Prevotella sp.]
MKQIGYIYKYRKVENKGILVYGKWKDNNSATNAPRPMLFSKSDCITKVDTGQLVYFELIEGELANIERASLSNFNKKVIKEIITPKKGDVYNWYSEKTTISFENLNDIVQPKKELENKHSNSNNKDLEFDDIHGDIALDKVKDKNTNSVYDIKISDIFDDDQFEPVQLPETIEGIFDCFGKYQHDPFNCLFDESDDIYDEYGNNSISISILDMSLWIDEQTCKQICFGEKYEELKYLYDVFILKKWRNKNGFYYTPNKCISNSWKLLLAKFSNKELERIAVKFPLLQPVLPIQFCKEHLDYLSDEYGMPNLAICKLFIHNSIKKVSTASSYNSWSKKLLDYKSGKDNCQEQEEGVTMYELGNDYLDYISDFTTVRDRINSPV